MTCNFWDCWALIIWFLLMIPVAWVLYKHERDLREEEEDVRRK